jgi:hypothetical protein
MIERIVALGGAYLGTRGALARTEALEDSARLRTAAWATLLAALVTALGVLWLNVAVPLWLMTTPWAIGGAFAFAAFAMLTGIVMSGSARRGMARLRPSYCGARCHLPAFVLISSSQAVEPGP